MEFIELVVAEMRDETPRVRSYLLKRADGGLLPAFEPGAHVEVTLQGAQGESLVRHYSLCGEAGASDSWRLGVLREDDGRGGSLAVHRNWLVGTRLRCGAPKNQFPLVETPLPSGAKHVLIAGGIGITPLLAMARTLRARGESWVLHYAARSQEDAAFLGEVQEIAADHLHLYFDGGDPTRGIDVRAVLNAAGGRSHVYVCGPRPLNEAVIAAAADAGWPREHVHHEFFGAAKPAAGDESFTVHLRASGLIVQVSAKESILDACQRVGVEPLYDCRRGECGLCATTVASGEVDHRDYVLSEADRKHGRQMCICVSRAHSRELVLEL